MVTPSQGSERRARHADLRRGKHRTEEAKEDFSRGFDALGELALAGVQLSARATDLATGKVLFSVDDHVVMPTASIGKVLLLVEVAARLAGDETEAFTVLDRAPRDAVGDSGIWQHLQSPSLPIADLAVNWDAERSERLFTLIRENRADEIGKRLCTPTGRP